MKKIDKIMVGTHNNGKFKEISYLLPKYIKKISPKKFNIKSPKEIGKSFQENSKLKAKYFSKKSGLISISDDSGLVIDCLNGKPGIHSARWAIKYGSFKKAMNIIINLVNNKNKNKKNKNFKASFICSLTVKFPNAKIVNVTGKIFGKISKKIIGTKGFGYDPIFIPKNKKYTFGQMSNHKKINMDHRFIAYKKLKKKVKIL